ncbi:MAG: radical SAM protein, partial [Deltaproteobacteria bacterium]|nr:radical SAM protein [Deltaproteobacteria bacterium]
MSPTLKELCIEITNVCPMACLHCSTSSIQLGTESGGRNIPVEKIAGAVKDFKNLGGEILEISGGEPLLHPHLFEIIELAVSHDLEVRLYTAGIMPSKEASELVSIDFKLAQDLKSIGVSRVIFSLQGAVSQTHDKIVGFSGAHSLALKSIRNIKEAGLWTGIHFVPMALNFHEIEAMMDLG